MATLKSTQFQAIESGPDASNLLPLQGRSGKALHYEVSFPSTVAAGDNMIIDFLGNNYILPELGRIASDGGATALTVDLGWGTYNKSTGTLDVSGSNGDVDAFCDGYVADSADATNLLHNDTPTAGVFTRVAPSIGEKEERVLVLTAVSETLGENATIILDLPVSPYPTS